MAALVTPRFARIAVLPLILLALGLGVTLTVPWAHADTNNGCQLNSPSGSVNHVINIVFDNTHFTRDNPNVPSDLEQMPNLLNFIRSNGTLLTNHHTPLISHTGTDILTTLTGVYGDRHGVPVSNSFRYFNPDGTSNLGVAFAYWTSPIFDPTTSTPTNTTFNMLTADGKNAPAPWVPFTRAGCSVGAAAAANVVLENIGVDIPTVFGANSAEAAEVAANPKQAFADFDGIAVHCAQGAALCSTANNGRPDLLPNEPGGYSVFNGLFGHKYVARQISPSGPMADLNGNVITNAKSGTAGFPGFDGMFATVSLAYVAAMQEHGIPVTFAYINDSHDLKAGDSQVRAFGPGEAGYVAQLKAVDDAFGKFFARLAQDGINASNTLFVFSSDEGDHFAGSAASPAGCDGVNVACTYSQIGEVNVNTTGLLVTQKGETTPFKMHNDVAPTFYITGNPAPTDNVTRTFERNVGELEALNPYTGANPRVALALADPVEEKLLHLITADPTRTPTVTMFALPDFFLFDGPPNCDSPCITVNPRFAWNHGSVSPEITITWVGLVGPGVRAQSDASANWSDHADLRPTILSLLGLQDDYSSQGRVLFENFTPEAVPVALSQSSAIALQLGQLYKQINAPVGELSLNSLVVSTRALKGDDDTYSLLESKLTDITVRRDALAARIASVLEGAEFRGQSIDEQQAQSLITQARALLTEVRSLAATH